MILQDRYCVLCGPQANKKVKFAANFSDDDFNAAVFSARRMPDGRHYRFVKCSTCGMIYSDPVGDPSRLADLYATSLVTYARQEEQIYDSYAPILDRALPGLMHRGAFVEIGGGRGFLLRYGHEKGFASQIEIEPSEDAAKRFLPSSERSRFIRGLFAKGLLPRESTSLVCFFQVLDHIPDPRAFLDEVYEVLEPGGAAVCVTHNTRALSARLLGERSPIFDIEHTYLFNRSNLATLFKNVGFADVEAFPIANRYSLRYWWHLAPLPGGIKGVGLRMLEKVRLADRKIGLYAGNFGIVAWKAPRKVGSHSPARQATARTSQGGSEAA
jgi:SAM-dependent methyltransferase